MSRHVGIQPQIQGEGGVREDVGGGERTEHRRLRSMMLGMMDFDNHLRQPCLTVSSFHGLDMLFPAELSGLHANGPKTSPSGIPPPAHGGELRICMCPSHRPLRLYVKVHSSRLQRVPHDILDPSHRLSEPNGRKEGRRNPGSVAIAHST